MKPCLKVILLKLPNMTWLQRIINYTKFCLMTFNNCNHSKQESLLQKAIYKLLHSLTGLESTPSQSLTVLLSKGWLLALH
jgi:hypothetical protein